ncbi:anti-sigma factor domain-containing protein [Streptomyces sp. NPDC056437]|uniref:anti-sigma factor n=1 Tax=Streptomyces sp. NPDC056437 TaxID=3345816 RepID=UPI0036B01A33
MTTADLHTATGAYVLHALPEDERAAFETHLAACEACRQEVAELRATAARLGLAVAVTPPDAMRDSVLRRTAGTRQEFKLLNSERMRRPAQRLPRLVMAACVAAAAAFGGIAVWQHEEADSARTAARQAEQREASVADVLAAPDARLQTRALSGGATATVAVSRSEDAAALVVAGLPELPADKVYEAWYAGSGNPRPAGLLQSASGRQLALLDGPVGDATAVAVTVEPAGGSPQPTTVPLGAITLPA